MLSFPYNSSSPILYYNKDIFEKAGPRRRQPAEDLGRGLGPRRARSRTSGAAPCGYTSTWLTWIHLENFAAWNDLPYATNENGLAEGRVGAAHQRADLRRRTSRRSPTSPRRACSSTAAAPRRPSRSSSRGECGIFTESLGRPRRHRQVGHELRHRPAALRRGRRGRAAEHHPGRREPLGVRRQVGRGLQGRRRLLRLPVADRGAGSTCTRPRATCR